MPRCLTRNGPATTPVDPGLRGRLALRGGQRQQLVGERLDLALDGRPVERFVLLGQPSLRQRRTSGCRITRVYGAAALS